MNNTSANREVVIVTGSSGYIGSAMIEVLAAASRVLDFEHETVPASPVGGECICIGLTNRGGREAALDRLRTAHGARIAAVVHLAACFDLTGERNPASDAVTPGGTRNLLRCLPECELA